jgi:hypothetical protein
VQVEPQDRRTNGLVSVTAVLVVVVIVQSCQTEAFLFACHHPVAVGVARDGASDEWQGEMAACDASWERARLWWYVCDSLLLVYWPRLPSLTVAGSVEWPLQNIENTPKQALTRTHKNALAITHLILATKHLINRARIISIAIAFSSASDITPIALRKGSSTSAIGALSPCWQGYVSLFAVVNSTTTATATTSARQHSFLITRCCIQRWHVACMSVVAARVQLWLACSSSSSSSTATIADTNRSSFVSPKTLTDVVTAARLNSTQRRGPRRWHRRQGAITTTVGTAATMVVNSKTLPGRHHLVLLLNHGLGSASLCQARTNFQTAAVGRSKDS